MSEPRALFVYGTLKRGESNYWRVESLVASIATGCTITGTLYHLGPYPGLVLDGAGEIRGEMLYSDSLEGMLRITDELEGTEYERVAVTVRRSSDPNDEQPAWVYRYLGDTSRLARIDAGEWRPAHASRETT